MATAPPGPGSRERLAATHHSPKGKANMSAKALAACSFEQPAEQTVTTDGRAPEGHTAEIQFREGLWHEYRLEAIKAGFSATQATEYASALSPEMGLVGETSEMAPAGRGWFYQGRIQVVKQTHTSGLIRLTRWKKSQAIGRTAAAGTSIFAFSSRPWNAGPKH